MDNAVNEGSGFLNSVKNRVSGGAKSAEAELKAQKKNADREAKKVAAEIKAKQRQADKEAKALARKVRREARKIPVPVIVLGSLGLAGAVGGAIAFFIIKKRRGDPTRSHVDGRSFKDVVGEKVDNAGKAINKKADEISKAVGKKADETASKVDDASKAASKKADNVANAAKA